MSAETSDTISNQSVPIWPPQHAVCLTIDKRADHREPLRESFAQHGLGVEFFQAGDGKLEDYRYDHVDVEPPSRSGTPAWANRANSFNAYLCFKKILTRARDEDWSSVLLLEDDAVITDVFDDVLREAVEEMQRSGNAPDALYLGANHTFCRTELLSPHVLRLNGSGCFHAVVLYRAIFQDVLDLPMSGPIDSVVGKMLHRPRQCYAVWPSIVLTRPGFSYCEGRPVNYGEYWGNRGC
jgi:hypothetical protein